MGAQQQQAPSKELQFNIRTVDIRRACSNGVAPCVAQLSACFAFACMVFSQLRMLTWLEGVLAAAAADTP
jgi:hypothetical protein